MYAAAARFMVAVLCRSEQVDLDRTLVFFRVETFLARFVVSHLSQITHTHTLPFIPHIHCHLSHIHMSCYSVRALFRGLSGHVRIRETTAKPLLATASTKTMGRSDAAAAETLGAGAATREGCRLSV